MLDVCICIWLDTLYHDDWSRMGYVGTLCGYLLLETSTWVNCVGTLLYILLAHYVRLIPTHNVPQCTTKCAGNTHYTQSTHWVFITRHRRLRLNISRVPTIIASSLFTLPIGFKQEEHQIFSKGGHPEKNCCSFGFCPNQGGRALPKIAVSGLTEHCTIFHFPSFVRPSQSQA